MRRSTLPLCALLSLCAGCVPQQKRVPSEDFSDLAALDEKSDAFSSRMKILGTLASGQTSAAVAHSKSPPFRAYRFAARRDDFVDVRVRSTSGDAVAWLVNGSFQIIAENDDADGSFDAHLTAVLPGNSDPANVSYYVVYRDFDPESRAPFTVQLAIEAAAQTDPGVAPWIPVPESEVLARCHLDPKKLAEADAKLGKPWAIVRYGLLCHEHKSAGMTPSEAWSTTKTLGATVAGAVAFRTRGLVATGPKTGPFRDDDPVKKWVDHVSYNPQARVAHVLGMVAHNDDLSLGNKEMRYDATGVAQINSLSDMLNAVLKQDSARLGTDLEQFTRRFVFGPLGITDSKWTSGRAGKVFAFSWVTTVRDMARIGLLLLHRGVWSGQRLVDTDWIYRMTHPSFEDANTGYGYLTWLNSSSNFTYGGIIGPPSGRQQRAQLPGPCAPVAVHATHPHGASDSPDCNYAPPYTCEQPLDVGVWQAIGLGGQLIQGHPGLDMVIVARDITPVPFGAQLGTGNAAPAIVWDAVRPAIVAADPTFAGDDAGFCAAYGSNTYAPDLAQ
jgi:hypothetical protein